MNAARARNATPRPVAWVAGLLVALTAGAGIGADRVGAREAAAAGMLGFSTQRAGQQRALEQRFDALLDPNDQRDWLEQLAAEPNHVGSPHDKANAEFMLARYLEWGWDARIERFDVLYPTPKKISLALLAPVNYKARLHEDPVAGDATSAREGELPPYNVYGGDGDVTAPLVYANYGMPGDYAELARRGIDVRGKIVITRYGGGWRGLKPKLAQEHGAAGCLIYSDPREDGYFAGDAYPKGGWRPADGVQRGSVADMPVYPGDPLTPGVGATPDAKRLPLAEAKTVLKIPVLPISYADATPLLKALQGPQAPVGWRGALPLTYRIGGTDDTRARLVVQSDWQQKPVYDVIAVLRGASEPDRWIVRGNHHDGWVAGAWDPLSGNVAMMAEAKAIGALVKQGWRPRRTLVYASWDGEEPGLLGSTEWAEMHATELRQKAVLYLNSDTNGRGFLEAGGSHALQRLVNQAAADVTDPQTQASVGERLRARMMVSAASADADPEDKANGERVDKGGDLPIYALGSGSDYSAFLEHLGIASLNLGFGGEDDQNGVYHSRYDTFEHYVRFGDPGFAYGVALSKVAGRVVLRMADADLLPMRFGDFGSTLTRYVDELHALVDSTRKATAQQHRLLDVRAYALETDPTRPVAPPARDSDVPAIDLTPLDKAASGLARSAQAFDRAYAAQAARGFDLPDAKKAQVNALMGRMEQALGSADGLPGRPWFRHMVYAPGLLTGYGTKTLPGVREALESRRWEEAGRYARVTASVLDDYRAQLDAMTRMLER